MSDSGTRRKFLSYNSNDTPRMEHNVALKLLGADRTRSKVHSLCVGDYVSFFTEDLQGFMFSDGFADVGLYVQVLKENDLCVPDFGCCVFRITPKLSYHSRLQLDQFLLKRGVRVDDLLNEDVHDKVDIRDREQLERLQQAAIEERDRNLQVTLLNEGRPLRFSDSFQLLHARSAKYLKAVFENAADVEGNQVQLVLSENWATAFRLRSCHFQHSLANETVRDMEAVYILPEGLIGAALNCKLISGHSQLTSNQLRYEVSLFGSGVGWFIQHYARDNSTHADKRHDTGVTEEDESFPSQLRCGQVVRLLQTHHNAYLATTPNMTIESLDALCSLVIFEVQSDSALKLEMLDSQAKKSYYKSSADMKPKAEQPSVHSLWLIEGEDPSRGASLHYGDPIRLRNVATGTYLTLRRSEIVANPACLRSTDVHQSLFACRRLPEQRDDDDAIRDGCMIWLSYCGEGRSSTFLHSTKQSRDSDLELSIINNIEETDGFMICSVSFDNVAAAWRIVSALKAIVQFVKSAEKKEIDPVGEQRLCKILDDLGSFISHPNTSNSTSVPGDMLHDIRQRQAILREVKILDFLICHLTNFQKWSSIFSERPSKNSDMSCLKELSTCSCKLLHVAVQNNEENGLHLVQFLEVIFANLLLQMDSETTSALSPDPEITLADVVLDIYRDNLHALRTINERIADLFLETVRTQKYLRPKCIELLCTILVHRGEGIPNNQRLICNKLLDQPACMPETRKRGEVVQVKMPSVSKSGSVLKEIKDLSRDPLESEYYYYFVKLLSCFLQGRTRSVDDNKKALMNNGMISFDLCYTCLICEDLSPQIRAAYCRLIMDAFIDSPPQESRTKCDDLQIWSEIYHQPLQTNAKIDEHLDDLLGVKAFALRFLETQSVQGKDQGMDSLTISVLDLVEHLVRMGFYNHTAAYIFNSRSIHKYPQYQERYKAFCAHFQIDPATGRNSAADHDTLEFELLVQPILCILDSSTDQISSGKSDKTLKSVQEVKICCCKIVDLLCDLRLILNCKMLLRCYDRDLQNGLVPHFDAHGSNVKQSGAPRPEFERVIRSHCSLDKTVLTTALAELLKFHDNELDQCAMRLVLRLNGQRSFLLNQIYRTELLVNETVVHLYREHRSLIQDMDESIITLMTLRRKASETNKSRKQFVDAEKVKKLQQEILQEETLEVVKSETVTNDNITGGFLQYTNDFFGGIFSLGLPLGHNSDLQAKPQTESKDTTESLQNPNEAQPDTCVALPPEVRPNTFDRIQNYSTLLDQRSSSMIEDRMSHVHTIDHESMCLCAERLSKSVQTMLADCSIDCTESTFLSLQTQFRELNIQKRLIQMLQTLCQEGLFLDDPRLSSLAKQCCLLCAKFCIGNVKNAYLLYPHLELFIRYLGDNNGLEVKAHEVVLSIFKDNRLICTQASHLIENRTVALIGSVGQKYPYLQLLEALLCPCGVPIQQNQVRIAKSLNVHRDKVLSLYEGRKGLRLLKSIHLAFHGRGPLEISSRREPTTATFSNGVGVVQTNPTQVSIRLDRGSELQYPCVAETDRLCEFDDYDCKVTYFCTTLKVLAKLSAGPNKITEGICSKLLPLNRCIILLTATWFLPEAKIDCLDFIYHCYVDVEMTAKHSVEFMHNEHIWKCIQYFAETMEKLANPSSNVAFCKPKEPEEKSRKIVTAFLPIAKLFFSSYFRRARANENESALSNSLCDSLVRYFTEVAKVAKEHIAIADVLETLEKRYITGSDASTQRMLRSLLQSSKMNSALELNDQKGGLDSDSKIMMLFPSFRLTFKARINIEKELGELVKVCQQHPRTITVIISQLTHPDVENDLKNVYVRTIEILWSTKISNDGLQACMDFIQLDSLILSLITLIAQGRGFIVRQGLRLANHLLRTGEFKVQERFRMALRHSNAKTLLEQLNLRLEIACDEIREQDTIVQQVVTNFHSEAKAGEKLTLRKLMTDANMFDELSMDDQNNLLTDASYISDVLKFLQLLCKGHYLTMQNLVRSQGRGDEDIDLVTAIAEFIVELQSYISPLNVKMAIQAFETLTELLQGPCKLNIHAVLKTTNFLETLNHLLHNDHVSLEGVAYTADYFDALRELRARVAASILAMLEAATFGQIRIAEILIRSLDLTNMVEYVKNLYAKWDSQRQRQEKAGLDVEDVHISSLNKSLLETGHAYYIVLKTLKEFTMLLPIYENAALAFKSLDECTSAMEFYRRRTGCLEIARKYVNNKVSKSELLRVHFPIPQICNSVTKEMKQNIVFGVDRSNDAMRLRDFVSSVDDLFFDMKYVQWTNSNNFLKLVILVGSWVNQVYVISIFLLNFMIMIFLTWRTPNQSDPDAAWQEMKHLNLNGDAEIMLQFALPTVQVILEGAMLLYYVITKLPAVIRKRFKAEFNQNLEDDEAEGRFQQFDFKLIKKDIYFYISFVRHLFSDANFTSGQCFVWRLFTFILSVAINVNLSDADQLPLIFYGVLLWEIFPRSKQIGFVLKAISQSGSQLLSLAGMILICSYFLAVIGFLVFPQKFQFRKGEVVDGSTQENDETGFNNPYAVPLQFIYQGITMVVDQGVRKDDVGEALDKFLWPIPCPNPAEFGCKACAGPVTYECIANLDCTTPEWEVKKTAYDRLDLCGDVLTWPFSQVFIRMAYTLAFWMWVSAVCLELVFGVIIDAFKQLREAREDTLKDVTNKCFICGIDRNAFDLAKSDGFDGHCKNEHNMWLYMYYLVHIREKNPDTWDGTESYVSQKAKTNDVGWFPVGQALSLNAALTGASTTTSGTAENSRLVSSILNTSLKHFEKHLTQSIATADTILRSVLALEEGALPCPDTRDTYRSRCSDVGTAMEPEASPAMPAVVKEAFRRAKVRQLYGVRGARMS